MIERPLKYVQDALRPGTPAASFEELVGLLFDITFILPGEEQTRFMQLLSTHVMNAVNRLALDEVPSTEPVSECRKELRALVVNAGAITGDLTELEEYLHAVEYLFARLFVVLNGPFSPVANALRVKAGVTVL